MKLIPTCILLFTIAMNTMAAVREDVPVGIYSTTFLVPQYDYSKRVLEKGCMATVMLDMNEGGCNEFICSYDIINLRFTQCEWVWRTSDSFYIRTGVQKAPYLMEANYSPRELEAFTYSLNVLYLGGFFYDISGISSRSMDCGLSVNGKLFPRGNRHLINYHFGVFNGNGYSFKDDNRFRDLEGRIVFHPVPAFRLSTGVLLGHQTMEDGTTGEKRRYALEAWYDGNRSFARTGVVWATTDGIKSASASAMIGYWITSKCALSMRFDRFQKDIFDSKSVITNTEFFITRHIVGTDVTYRLQYCHTFNASSDKIDQDILGLCLIFRIGKHFYPIR